MSACYFLLVDRICVHHANAISSPLTYGFPAISAFVGMMHRLNRCLPKPCEITGFESVLIASHRCTPYLFRADKFSDARFIQKRHPVRKNGESASIIEEGKVDLEISLVFKVCGDAALIKKNKEALEAQLENLIQGQRIAGGHILSIKRCALFDYDYFVTIEKLLFPAYILCDASLELSQIQEELRTGKNSSGETTNYPAQLDANELDALLATAQIFHIPPQDSQDEWKHYSVKQNRGWLVPIPIGYQAISPEYAAGEMLNTRHPNYPSQYVEAVYGLGQWIFPHQMTTKTYAFWQYDNSLENYYLVSPTTLFPEN